jgi:tetratricopeptide (TPR) repeat protein
MAPWTAYHFSPKFRFTPKSVKKHWSRLHTGDREPMPQDETLLAAWAAFHRGEFEQATKVGLSLGLAGYTVANKATCIYANHLEPREKTKLELFLQVSERASEHIAAQPTNANAHYLLAYALGRYSQGISVAKALAKGLGGKVKSALETAIRLEPLHADAHIALGTFHAEVIDKVGALIGNMTYGAKKDTGHRLLEYGLGLYPDSPSALLEYAHGMVLLDAERYADHATELYQKVLTLKPLDACDRLSIELARAELLD